MRELNARLEFSLNSLLEALSLRNMFSAQWGLADLFYLLAGRTMRPWS